MNWSDIMTKRAVRSWLGTLCALLALGFADDAAAQDLWYGGSWGVGQSLSDTKDFSDDFSFRNADLEFRIVLGDVSFGASSGWHVFHQELIEATELEEVPVTAAGLQFRTVNTVP